MVHPDRNKAVNVAQPEVKGRKSIRLPNTPQGVAVPVSSSTRRRLLRDDLLLRVKIEAPAGDPARLSEAQHRRLIGMAAVIKGELSREDFLAMENPGQAENINLLSQEDLPMLDVTLNGREDEASTENPKKKYTRRAKTVATATPAVTAAEGGNGTVRLTPEQASKLWEAVTGGKIFIGSLSEVTIEVTLDSFPRALPVLLDWMGSAASTPTKV